MKIFDSIVVVCVLRCSRKNNNYYYIILTYFQWLRNRTRYSYYTNWRKKNTLVTMVLLLQESRIVLNRDEWKKNNIFSKTRSNRIPINYARSDQLAVSDVRNDPILCVKYYKSCVPNFCKKILSKYNYLE